MKRILLLIILIALPITIYLWKQNSTPSQEAEKAQTPAETQVTIKETPLTLKTPPVSKTLKNNYHIYQTFNNCGPASLSMTLSYYGISKSQKELGDELRPYQNQQGDNDDKSVTLFELADIAPEFNLVPFHRPNGNINLIKLFITYDIPVITRTWLKLNDDVGHFRIVKGYDDTKQEIIQDDSYQGPNLKFSYSDFNELWKKYNYEYIVIVTKDKEELVKKILGENADEQIAWKGAVESSNKMLAANPDDVYARFNLSIALYHVGEFKKSTEEFEKVENKLSPKTLWYQTEPIEAYFQIGNYDRVFSITDKILNNGNRAYSELYIIRGKIYLIQGKKDLAKAEFEKAYFYNKNMVAAQEALASVK